MLDDLKQLTPPEKKVAAKQLILAGYSSRKVQEILGIDNVTAWRYVEQPTPEELKQFETIFKNFLNEQKQKGLNLVYKRLLELLPKERKIDQLVKAGEFLEGKEQASNQININNLIKVE